MDNAISRAEHEEFKKRLEEENRRINRRLELLEDNINEVRTITVSVEKLAVNMENMLKEQVRQGERLDILEARDGDKWRSAIKTAATAAISAAAGYIIRLIGIGG